MVIIKTERKNSIAKKEKTIDWIFFCWNVFDRSIASFRHVCVCILWWCFKCDTNKNGEMGSLRARISLLLLLLSNWLNATKRNQWNATSFFRTKWVARSVSMHYLATEMPTESQPDRLCALCSQQRIEKDRDDCTLSLPLAVINYRLLYWQRFIKFIYCRFDVVLCRWSGRALFTTGRLKLIFAACHRLYIHTHSSKSINQSAVHESFYSSQHHSLCIYMCAVRWID